MHKKTIRCLILLLLAITGSVRVVAQSNPFAIDEGLYQMYLRASDNVNKYSGIEIADSMFYAAEKVGDKKAMCLSRTIPIRYYSGKRMHDSLEVAANKLSELASATGFRQYFYYAEAAKIVFDLNNKRFYEAIEGAQKLRQTAFEKDTLPYGRFSAIQTLGHVYVALHNNDLAIAQYKEALDYAIKHMPNQDGTDMAVRLGSLYLEKGDVDSAAYYCDMALKRARTKRIQAVALMLRARVLFRQGNGDEFSRAYKHAYNNIYDRDILTDSATIYRFLIDKALADGDKRVALSYASRFNDRADCLDAYTRTYEYFGDYESALKCARRRFAYIDSLRQQILSDEIASLDQIMGNHQLREDYRRITEKQGALSSIPLWFRILVVVIVLALVVAVVMLRTGRYAGKSRRDQSGQGHDDLDIRRASELSAQLENMNHVQRLGRSLRNPINAIIGFTQLLSDTETFLSPDLRKRYASIIRANSNLLMSLIDDMTDVTELEIQMREVSPSDISPNAIVREVVSMSELRMADSSNTSISLKYTSELTDDYVIHTDGERLAKVLNYLLVNAEKFTGTSDGGEICVGVSLSENLGRITFSVTDTGIGIAPENAEVIFGRFTKLNNAMPGNGLGLYVARLIVGNLGGEIYLDKNYTGGARFVVVLPLSM